MPNSRTGLGRPTRSFQASFVSLVLAVSASGCRGSFDADPSEYWKEGESFCDPAGAPQAASVQGHVANWWHCVDVAAMRAWDELRTWDTFTGERIGAAEAPGGPDAPLPWLPAYASDGWIVMLSRPSVPGLTLRSPEGVAWWSVPLPAEASTNPSLTKDDAIVLGDVAGVVHAFSKDGASLWSASLGGPAINRIVIARDGSLAALVKVGAKYELVSVEWGGAIRWRVPAEVATSSPIITKDDRFAFMTYLGDAGDDPADPSKFRLRAHDPADGAMAWELVTGADAFGPVEGPDGTLYVADVAGGGVRAVRPADGTEKWKTTVTPDGAAPSVLDNGWLVIGCGDGLCVLDAGSGALLGSMPAGESGVVHGPFAFDGILSAPTTSGHYYVWTIGPGTNTARGCWARLGGDDAFTGRAK